MSKQLTFIEAWERHFKKLEQYVPIVARVHGGITQNSMKFINYLIQSIRNAKKRGQKSLS